MDAIHGASAPAGEQIRDAALSWAGVTAHPHRYSGAEFRLGTREIGHVHGDTFLDVPFPKRVRDELVAARLAQPHTYAPDSGWVSFPIKGPGDIESAIALLRRSYDLAVSQRERNAARKNATKRQSG